MPYTAEDIRKYREEHQCSLYEAKNALFNQETVREKKELYARIEKLEAQVARLLDGRPNMFGKPDDE